MKFPEHPPTSPSRKAAGLFLVLAALSGTHAATLSPNYTDAAGEGFKDSTLGADRKIAFEYALGLWSSVLGDGYVGETITVDAFWDDTLFGNADSAVLASAGPTGGGSVALSDNPTGDSNVVFASGLFNHLAKGDFVPGSEISARFNPNVDGNVVLGATTFYYGTDNNGPANTTDFVSTALHEIGHGLGWSGSVDLAINGSENDNHLSVNQGDYINDTRYFSYDYFVQRTSDGAALTSLNTADRLAAIEGDNISWAGALGIAANGGTAPDLFGPNPAQGGSSYSHLDEGDFPTELMSPQATAGTGHSLSALTLAILEDQGWTLNTVPEPGSLVLLALGGLFLGRRRR